MERRNEKEMDSQKKLIKVPIDYLWAGLTLVDDVYNPKGTVLLIPRGEMITERKLVQLSHFVSEDRCVATYEASYQIIVAGEKAPKNIRQKMLENESGYSGLKKGVEQVLKISQSAAQVEREAAESVVEDVVESIGKSGPSAIFGCIHVPRPIDERLQRHLLNVGFLNGMIGQWMKLSGEEIRKLVLIGILHDIGKTKIPEEILDAPRRLTEEEYQIVKAHPVYSRQLLGAKFDEQIKKAVLYHHERADGSGYPEGLKGEKIPLFARITAISDVYDAMVSERCYKAEVVPFEILERVKKAEFEGLDPILVALFVKNMIKYYKHKKVRMSDDRQGDVVYIPPNDINHPIVRIGGLIRQTDDKWYPVQVI